MTKTLNSCINWDAEAKALDVVKNWRTEQLAEVENRIQEKENHIRQLQAEKKRLLNQQAPSTTLNTFESERRAKETELNEISNHPMRKHFWKKKIEELQSEIDDIDSKKKLTAHRKEETAVLCRDIDKHIKEEEKSIENYKVLLAESSNILEELKVETRMRTGVPFSAVDFTGLIELLDEYVDEGKIPFAITIQVGASTLKLLADIDGTRPVFGATLNNDMIFTDEDENEIITETIKALQTVFRDSLSKVYDLDEQPAQAMNGQMLDKEQMEEIYGIAGNITKWMENLNAEMNRYYRAMHLPISFSEDGRYHGNDSLNTLENRVEKVLDVMAQDVLDTPQAMAVPAQQETVPYVVPDSQPQMQESAPVQGPMPAPMSTPAPVKTPVKKPEPASVQPMPAPAKPKLKKPRKQSSKAPVSNQGHTEGEVGNGMLYSSAQAQEPQTQRLPKGLVEDMNAQPVADPNIDFSEFDHKFRAGRRENLEQSKKTEVEANSGRMGRA